MTKKLFQLLTLLASLAMTGCGWDDSLYKAYVDPEAEMPVTLCPSVCVPLNSENLKDKIDLNADGSCPEGYVHARYPDGKLVGIVLGDGKVIRLDVKASGKTEADDSQNADEGFGDGASLDSSEIDDVQAPSAVSGEISAVGVFQIAGEYALEYDLTQDKLDLFLSAVKEGLCPTAYHTCQQDFKNPGEFYCLEDTICVSDKPYACYVRKDGKVTQICTDLSNDREHCGECGHACGENESCRNGVCNTGCPHGTVLCNAQCIDLRVYHLKNCTACQNGYDNCDDDSAEQWINGCETNLDALHLMDKCQGCKEGYSSCLNMSQFSYAATGCMINTDNDKYNCGTCENVCPMNQICKKGSCACPDNMYLDSDNNCYYGKVDSRHCGTNNNGLKACGEYQACIEGECRCPDKWTLGTDGKCYNTQSDVKNCGSVGNACGTYQSCVNGTCACPSGWVHSNNICYDIKNDVKNCGSVGKACGAYQSCVNGACACPSGWKLGTDGVCYNIKQDNTKCGDSMINCTSFSAFCNGGTCKCVSDTHSICSSKCVNLKTDVNNCGKCGTKCTSAQTCTNGACKAK